MHLRGVTAFVTGAAQGLGKAFSEKLLSRGATVCITDIQAKKGREVESEFQHKYGKGKAIFIECDVRSVGKLFNVFKEALSKLGHIDLMVNNAGIGDESRLRDMVDINLVSVIEGTCLAIDHMRKDQGGRGGKIINVSSVAGLAPVNFMPNYAATKHGVNGFTASWASNPHVKELGLQFATLCPAFTRTAILDLGGDKVIFQSEASEAIKNVGINKVDIVADAFLMLVESDDCNGDVVTITKKSGIQYNKKNGKNVKPRL